MSEPYVPVPHVPRLPDDTPVRCPLCRSIVGRTWRGLPLARGTGYCSTHGLVLYVRSAS